MSIAQDLTRRFGEAVRVNWPLAHLTSFGIGGPADVFLEVGSSAALVDALRIAHQASVPVTLFGGGTNVLVSDRGVRGLVIRPRHGAVDQPSHDSVRSEAGVTINGLVRWTIGRGLAGLEAWAGTPGTVGGGVYGNAHFQGRLLSEHITAVRVATRDGNVRDLDVTDMAFGYDRSRLQSSGEVLLWCLFRVSPGEPTELRARARESLAFRKRTQPLHMPSAGCIFQNLSKDEADAHGLPVSAGALIDRAGLKGGQQGDARVSPLHANFIVNEGRATAADVRQLVQRCRRAVEEKFGVVLREEIVYLGDF